MDVILFVWKISNEWMQSSSLKEKIWGNWVGATRGGSKFRQPLAKHAPEKLETKKATQTRIHFPTCL
jgi:hypothetical protein